jgi:deazaflavin-dependent oxidoreductase (nitroreductase family)
MTAESGNTAADAGAPPPRWVLKAMTRLHVILHRLSGGRRFNSVGGNDVCFVTMKRAKSGRTLTIPLMYIPYGAGVLLVASQGGAPKNPGWYFNLVKYPDIEVSQRDRRMTLRARVATADEKPELWPICDQHYAPYADYRARTNRDIPVFVCEPGMGV